MKEALHVESQTISWCREELCKTSENFMTNGNNSKFYPEKIQS